MFKKFVKKLFLSLILWICIWLGIFISYAINSVSDPLATWTILTQSWFDDLRLRVVNIVSTGSWWNVGIWITPTQKFEVNGNIWTSNGNVWANNGNVWANNWTIWSNYGLNLWYPSWTPVFWWNAIISWKLWVWTNNPQAALDIAWGVRIGNDTNPCIWANAWTTRYNSVDKKIEYCDGTNWWSILKDICSADWENCIQIENLYNVLYNVDSYSVVTNINLNTDIINQDRIYADWIAYRVNAPSDWANSVSRYSGWDSLTNWIWVWDELLLINMQWAASDYTDVWNYELVKVSSVTTTQVTFESNITKSYNWITPANQKVVIQRVPTFSNLKFEVSWTITASPWNGLVKLTVWNGAYPTWIVAFRTTWDLVVVAWWKIDASWLWYRMWAVWSSSCYTWGFWQQWESINWLWGGAQWSNITGWWGWSCSINWGWSSAWWGWWWWYWSAWANWPAGDSAWGWYWWQTVGDVKLTKLYLWWGNWASWAGWWSSRWGWIILLLGDSNIKNYWQITSNWVGWAGWSIYIKSKNIILWNNTVTSWLGRIATYYVDTINWVSNPVNYYEQFIP